MFSMFIFSGLNYVGPLLRFCSLCIFGTYSVSSLCGQEVKVLQAKHVAFSTHLFLAALLVTALKRQAFLFLGLHTATFFYSFVVDVCAVLLDLNEEAQWWKSVDLFHIFCTYLILFKMAWSK